MPRTKMQPRPGEDVSITEEMDETVRPYLDAKKKKDEPEMSQAEFTKGIVNRASKVDEDEPSEYKRTGKYVRVRARKPKG